MQFTKEYNGKPVEVQGNLGDGEELAEAIARRFPELEDDTYTPDDEEE